jgi:predicted amidophosphoribosyltransferase
MGAHIILIDDVVTTGATLGAAASALKSAGARRVDALVFAQAISRSLNT